MDKDTFKILEYMTKYKYKTLVNLTPIINKLFPFPLNVNDDEFNVQKGIVERFIKHLQDVGYITYNSSWSNLSNSKTAGKWFGNAFKDYAFEAQIELHGIISLNQERFNKSIKRNNIRQLLVLIITALISLSSVVIAWQSYHLASDISSQKQYLLPSKELIEQLKRK